MTTRANLHGRPVPASPYRAPAGPRLRPVPAADLRRLGQPPLRSEDEVMRPESLGAMQPSALSCGRYFVELMVARGWRIEPTVFDLDAVGAGIARYAIHAEGHVFEFVALSNPPVDGGRSGRVLDGARDTDAGLYEGRATDDQIATMRREMPKIYGGRASGDTLIWCRCNRSMRFFNHVVARLAEGLQPDPEAIAETGYLMRNVGIEGNGIYGTRPFSEYGQDHPLALPYMAQMLAGYMMREFALDLAEHLARVASPDAVPLSREVRHYLGIGNGSAIGLVFFVYNRPAFIGRWLEMRERLLATAASLRLAPGDPRRHLLSMLLARAADFATTDRIARQDAQSRTRHVAALSRLKALVDDPADGLDIADLLHRARDLVPADAAETLASCCMELVPDLRDRLLETFFIRETVLPAPRMSLQQIADLIARDYGWVGQLDLDSPQAAHFIWYQSISNDEPRRCTRFDTPLPPNMLRDVAREVRDLRDGIAAFGSEGDMATYLLVHPAHRAAIQRIELLADARFHTPHCNPFDAGFDALSLVRLVMIGFYGLDRPVDFLGRNARGIMFQGAPSRDALGAPLSPGWFYPELPGVSHDH
ncbi:MAG: hypothetical protein IAE87_12295 [Rhodobacteraceae bacterium]|jgi:hypothetical protein|nr:hypothetical protein [Paracoccaceae bacterium]